MTNQEYLAAVAGALGPLVAEVVFMGEFTWTRPPRRVSQRPLRRGSPL